MTSGEVRFALIGAGFIGRIHGLALQAVNHVFGDIPRSVSAVLIDSDPQLAERMATQLGFARWATDWRESLDEVDAVIVAVPGFLHREIALEAIARGKHLMCEKPVGRSVLEAEEIAEAAHKAGITNGVGFTYLRAPMIRHAAAIVKGGTFGRPVTFRGWHSEDYLADADVPFSWRLDAAKAGPMGALGDLGWHIISISRLLCGPITSLNGLVETVYPTRRMDAGGGSECKVENEDWAGILARFESGTVGLIEASRIAHGRKMDIGFELVLERGSIAFHGERANELKLYKQGDADGEQGFKTIRIDGNHPDYSAFLPAPAHGLGFNDLKTIELRGFLQAIAEGRTLSADLNDACCIARICQAATESAVGGMRIDQPEVSRRSEPARGTAVA